MKKAKLTEEPIAFALRRAVAGRPIQHHQPPGRR